MPVAHTTAAATIKRLLQHLTLPGHYQSARLQYHIAKEALQLLQHTACQLKVGPPDMPHSAAATLLRSVTVMHQPGCTVHPNAAQRAASLQDTS